jgi:hypothetical protein
MPQIIPLTDDASQTVNIVGYDILVQWNSFDNSWRMSLSQNSVSVIDSIKMTCGLFLLFPYQLGIGDFYVLQNTGTRVLDPTRESFTQGQHNLTYLTAEEIDALFA